MRCEGQNTDVPPVIKKKLLSRSREHFLNRRMVGRNRLLARRAGALGKPGGRAVPEAADAMWNRLKDTVNTSTPKGRREGVRVRGLARGMKDKGGGLGIEEEIVNLTSGRYRWKVHVTLDSDH